MVLLYKSCLVVFVLSFEVDKMFVVLILMILVASSESERDVLDVANDVLASVEAIFSMPVGCKVKDPLHRKDKCKTCKDGHVILLSRDEATGNTLDVGTCHKSEHGKCTKGDCDEGYGRFEYYDGDVYEGYTKWCDGAADSLCPNNPGPLRHGHGVVTYPNGANYDGEWEDGKSHGHGVLTFASGEKHDGEWKDNQQHGHGVYTYANGSKYDGEWKNGKKLLNGEL